MGSGSSKIEQDFEEIGEELPEKYIGLVNKANTCYVNSVLQSLYFCKEFRNELLNEQPFSGDSLAQSLQELFQAMASHKKRTGVLTPAKFLRNLRSLYSIFDNDDHHDSHEFLMAILDHLDSEFKKQKSPTLVESLFEGKSDTLTKCMGCSTVTKREEVFRDLSLEVKQNSSLIYSLNQYSAPEMLKGTDQFFCDKCNSKQDAEKKTLIRLPPRILICHLKRFKYSETLRRYTKVAYRVAFPSELRLMNTTEDCPDRLYELFAIVVHLGTGFQYGHYMVIVKSFGHWIRFDDEYIERVDENMIHYIFGSSKDMGAVPCGYLLFYRNRGY